MKRHDAREKAVQVLFQLDNTDLALEEAIGHVLKEDESDEFFEQLVHGVTEKQQEIDAALEKNLDNWSLARLPKIERTVLRIALYELQYMQDAPSRVVLNEAIELCKTFGDEKSSKFVNGVLSKFTQQ
jgi:transcription antitermination protein NusB